MKALAMATKQPISATKAKKLRRRASYQPNPAMLHNEIILACNRFFQKRGIHGFKQ